MKTNLQILSFFSGFLFSTIFSLSVYSQGWKPGPNDTLKSVRIISADKVKFSIYAPKAGEVKLESPDLPGVNQGSVMTKLDNGVWETTLSGLIGGAYRYNFQIDGVFVLDPKNTSMSESNMNAWSLFYLPGKDAYEVKDVPHGTVSEVTYFSKSLKKFKRLHVYLPPGYEAGSDKYPVFYLLHGAMDCDDSWSTVGRSGFITDNLIAAGKAVPMVIVMPAGHTGPFTWGNPIDREVDEFYEDFTKDLMPYAESHYRILTDKKHRAIAGLSMGGAQTLKAGISHLDQFSALGVFSSGIFGIAGGMGAAPSTEFEDTWKANLDNPDLKKGLNLVWFATGKEDFLLETSRKTVDMLRKHGFTVTYKETEGAHTWLNWRDYLTEFEPLLFR